MPSRLAIRISHLLLQVALNNGGPPGVLYEYIVVSTFYWLVAGDVIATPRTFPITYISSISINC